MPFYGYGTGCANPGNDPAPKIFRRHAPHLYPDGSIIPGHRPTSNEIAAMSPKEVQQLPVPPEVVRIYDGTTYHATDRSRIADHPNNGKIDLTTFFNGGTTTGRGSFYYGNHPEKIVERRDRESSAASETLSSTRSRRKTLSAITETDRTHDRIWPEGSTPVTKSFLGVLPNYSEHPNQDNMGAEDDQKRTKSVQGNGVPPEDQDIGRTAAGQAFTARSLHLRRLEETKAITMDERLARGSDHLGRGILTSRLQAAYRRPDSKGVPELTPQSVKLQDPASVWRQPHLVQNGSRYFSKKGLSNAQEATPSFVQISNEHLAETALHHKLTDLLHTVASPTVSTQVQITPSDVSQPEMSDINSAVTHNSLWGAENCMGYASSATAAAPTDGDDLEEGYQSVQPRSFI